MSDKITVASGGDATISSDIMEQVLVGGNLAALTPGQRTEYYGAVCKSCDLNPLTRPFEYIILNGKMVLYARRDCTDQLRSKRKISITIEAREVSGGAYVVTARATTPEGRTEESIGAVPIDKLVGEAYCNALMKAETKAKRRVTLSICGLGFTDESEIDSIPNARIVHEGSTTLGRDPAQEISQAVMVGSVPAPVETSPRAAVSNSGVAGTARALAPSPVAGVSPSISVDLEAAIKAFYGGAVKKSDLPKKAALLLKEKSGVSVVVRSLADIEPETALTLIDWIYERMESESAPANPQEAFVEYATPEHDEGPAPPHEYPEQTIPWADFLSLASKFAAATGHKLIDFGMTKDREPVPSVQYLVHGGVLANCRYSKPVVLLRDGAVKVSQADLVRIATEAKRYQIEAGKPGYAR